jgi:NAD(P)-dependent dehydrogenase (short-subunit alcohol dehydrogenase family)
MSSEKHAPALLRERRPHRRGEATTDIPLPLTLAECTERFRRYALPPKIAGDERGAADVVAFLASEEGRWITGQNVQAGGGGVRITGTWKQ